MSKSKHTNAICAVIIAATLLLTCLFMAGESFGLAAYNPAPAYASTLFDTSYVHSLDIIVEEADWQEMLDNALSEEYIPVSVVIDGEAVKNVGIRPKGNTSLSSIASSDSDRFSFKLEFDHYQYGENYKGLDKLALNNIAQDNTYLKDYVTYQMMDAFGVYAPLSSFIYITVNGEEWGLYLAVEGVEESFASREFGSNYGEIYKPDSMDMGDRMGGDEAGGFAEGDMPEGFTMPENFDPSQLPGGFSQGEMPEGFDQGDQMPEGFTMPEGGQGGFPQGFEQGQMPEGFTMPEGGGFPGGGGSFPGGGQPQQDAGTTPDNQATQNAEIPQNGGFPGGMGGGFGGMGSNSATTLQYTDDDPDSYSAIFDGAVFSPDTADKNRLIDSLKSLSAGSDIESAVDVEEVLRYFVVHNFTLNADSYTGSIIHNYYLYEEDGKLAMIPWDYNLAFGGMGNMGRGMGSTASAATDSATSLVNYPIDTPTLGTDMANLPMLNWIFESEAYTARYHELFAEFMTYFSFGEFTAMVDNAIALISPYVEKDPTAFCTYDEFVSASATLREFCAKRAESIALQLTGDIASTSDGQTESENANFVDASDIDVDSMGSQNMGFSGARGGFGGFGGFGNRRQ
jgi:hypothetical protein